MLSLFPRDVLDEIRDLIESVSEGFTTYTFDHRSNMGTTDNIFVLHGLITHLINQRNRLFCAFFDFSKAFDFVNGDNLLYKLIKFGVRGKILNVIKSSYKRVRSRVKYENEFECYLGVR